MATMILIPALAAAQESGSKRALYEYFDNPAATTYVKTWIKGGLYNIEIETDYGLLAQYPASANQNISVKIWDSLFLLKYFVDIDAIFSEKFGTRYQSVAFSITHDSANTTCNESKSEIDTAKCIVRQIASEYGVHYYYTRGDEGYRCLVPISMKSFKSLAKQACAKLRQP